MSVIVFPDEITIWISSLSNQKALPHVREPSPNLWRPEEDKRLSKRGFTLCLKVVKLGHCLLPPLDSDSNWNLHPWLSLFSVLWAKDMGLLSLHSYVSQFLKTNTMHQINKISWFCFSGEPWLMQSSCCAFPCPYLALVTGHSVVSDSLWPHGL